MIKYIKTIDADSLRRVCIQNHFYEYGNSEQYAHLLCDMTKGQMDTDKLESIACDILFHSSDEVRSTYEVEDVMWIVNNACSVRFERRD